VHLYSQGYTDANLVDFTLELTNPSTIFEKEKIDIWGSKVGVAKDMMENKLFSKDWIYKNIFNMSDDDILTSRNEVVGDVKQSWRFKQIEEEGNDPAVSLQKVNAEGELEDVGGDTGGSSGGSSGGFSGSDEFSPDGAEGEGEGGDEEAGELPPDDGGAPPEGDTGEEPPLTEKKKPRASQAGIKKASDYPFGEDPRGRLENNSVSRVDPIRHKFSKGSPLARESVDMSRLKKFMDITAESNKRSLIRESVSDGKTKSLLDESNILDGSVI
jgi:hypothetical protein